MGELSMLPNIGKEVESQLNRVGIKTFKELQELGSKQAWMHIKNIDDSACIHRLYAIEGAIRGLKKSELPKNVKEELKEFYNYVNDK
jgi:DNA transformation protein